MKMPGGGPFDLVSGQITDDSEMAMCLMWGLIDGNKDLDPKKDERVLSTSSIA